MTTNPVLDRPVQTQRRPFLLSTITRSCVRDWRYLSISSRICRFAAKPKRRRLRCRQSRSCDPDIMILDISLNGPDGLELLKNIRATDPDLPVLILSMHDEAIYAERALRARANGYIMKQEATEKVLVAVRRILNGEIYLSERMSNKMLQQYIGGAPIDDPVPHRLAFRSGTRGLSPDR